MLYLLLSESVPPASAFAENRAHIPLTVPRKWLQKPQDSHPLTVFYQDSPLYFSGSYRSDRLSVEYRGETVPSIIAALFAEKTAINLPDGFSHRFHELNAALRNPPVGLIVNRNGDGFRFEYIDPVTHTFIRAFVTDAEWNLLHKRVAELADHVNVSIRAGNPRILLQLIREGQDVLRELFDAINLPLYELPSTRRLDVFLTEAEPFLPLEFLPAKPLIGYYLPRKIEPSPADPAVEHITIVYSTELDHALKEVSALSGNVREWYDLELYSDENAELSGGTGVFHFIGHGEIRDGQSGVIVNGAWSHTVGGGYRSAVLDCCHLGRNPRGLIGDLIANGAEWVIASPYEIADDHGLDFERFYLFLKGGDDAIAHALTAFSQPLFYYYYRLYGFYRS